MALHCYCIFLYPFLIVKFVPVSAIQNNDHSFVFHKRKKRHIKDGLPDHKSGPGGDTLIRAMPINTPDMGYNKELGLDPQSTLFMRNKISLSRINKLK